MKLEFKRVIRETTLGRIQEIIAASHPQACLEGRYYVALKDGKIAGCTALVRRAWYVTELKHLFVKEEDRRIGIGKFLVEEAIKKVKTPLVCCTVRSDNERSLNLFTGKSFERVSSFQNSMTGQQILLMVKKMECRG